MGKYKNYDHIIKFKVITELTSPMHIGASFSEKNEVLVHPIDGTPFVQASSIAGVLRGYYEKNHSDQVATLFGDNSDEGDSRMIVSDGVFPEGVRYEIRPRVQIDPVSGTTGKSKVEGTGALSGHKFDMECIGKGAKLSFDIYVKGSDFNDEELLMEAFSAVNSGEITIGGQKSNGFGNVKIVSLLEKRFVLSNENDRKEWINEADIPERDYTQKKDSLVNSVKSSYRIKLNGMTESGILVKGYKKEGFGKDGADAVNIQDANGNYIIPGSSIKGSIRSQIERIVSFKGFSEEDAKRIIKDIFGEAETGGKIGNVRFLDTTIEVPVRELPITNRIHIDKLTGGVMNQGLFNEQKAYGDIEISIEVLNRNNPKRSCGYLILALRDLALNLYNLGGGYSIGNGMIKVRSIELEYGDQKAIIDMEDKEIKSGKDLIDKCIKATQEV